MQQKLTQTSLQTAIKQNIIKLFIIISIELSCKTKTAMKLHIIMQNIIIKAFSYTQTKELKQHKMKTLTTPWNQNWEHTSPTGH